MHLTKIYHRRCGCRAINSSSSSSSVLVFMIRKDFATFATRLFCTWCIPLEPICPSLPKYIRWFVSFYYYYNLLCSYMDGCFAIETIFFFTIYLLILVLLMLLFCLSFTHFFFVWLNEFVDVVYIFCVAFQLNVYIFM